MIHCNVKNEKLLKGASYSGENPESSLVCEPDLIVV